MAKEKIVKKTASEVRPECGMCKYWAPEGLCHRYPPTLSHRGKSILVPMASSDWCGEHKGCGA